MHTEGSATPTTSTLSTMADSTTGIWKNSSNSSSLSFQEDCLSKGLP